jgi:hypothetical protein
LGEDEDEEYNSAEDEDDDKEPAEEFRDDPDVTIDRRHQS